MFNQIIVSVISDIPRSSGDIFAAGSGTIVNTINTTIVDESEFYTLANALNSNSDTRDRVGAVSLDALFVPYTTYYESVGPLPKLTRPTATSSGTSYSLNPFNPGFIFGSGNNPSGVVDSGSFNTANWNSRGHTINNAMTINQIATESTISSGVHPASNHFAADYYSRGKVELVNVRGIALRAPLVLSGFGLDTSGNYVPSSGSSLHPNALWDTSLWKTGPLDVRWDQSRGVWTFPSGTGGGSTTTGLDCDCGCLCQDGYDLILSDGTKTTKVMRWIPPSQLEVDVANGHIYLPQVNQSGTDPLVGVGGQAYPLAWVTGTNATWKLDISNYLMARYTDTINLGDGSVITGSPATSGVSTSGMITFNRYDPSDSGLMSIRVDIVGSIASTGS
jgi:hypothetical protein